MRECKDIFIRYTGRKLTNPSDIVTASAQGANGIAVKILVSKNEHELGSRQSLDGKDSLAFERINCVGQTGFQVFVF